MDKLGWQPEITITPVTSVTLAISVTNVPAGLPNCVQSCTHWASRRRERLLLAV